jgi:hypothetical protein
VYANYNQVIGIFLLERLQVRKNVHAVRAAKGPEIKQDQLALKFFQRKRLGNINPWQALCEIWGFDFTV